MNFKTAGIKKITALFICLSMTLLILIWATFAIVHGQHQCVGETCPVCVQIQTVASAFKKLENGSLALAKIVIAFILYLEVYARVINHSGGFKSLVQQRVRMNN